MSFYEDMGVRRWASAEEVREQYRVLVRLFHPDQFSDAVMKAAAEGQLRRFNEIEAVLTDPAKRRVYDFTLLNERSATPIVIQAPPPARMERRIPWGSLAWGAAAMTCAGAIVWVSDHEAPAAPAHEIRQVGSSFPADSSALHGEEWRARARVAVAERDQALRELARLRGGSGEAISVPFASDLPRPAAAAEPPLTMPAPVPAPALEARKAGSHFAGIWFYARRAGTDNKLYAPEFIETQISERDGQVRGRYRSRYRVTDRAISPSVNFEFSGPAAGTSAQLPFIRDDGARGEVRLRLLSDREMELAWTASNSNSLNSGTAVLTRGQ